MVPKANISFTDVTSSSMVTSPNTRRVNVFGPKAIGKHKTTLTVIKCDEPLMTVTDKSIKSSSKRRRHRRNMSTENGSAAVSGKTFQMTETSELTW